MTDRFYRSINTGPERSNDLGLRHEEALSTGKARTHPDFLTLSSVLFHQLYQTPFVSF